MNEDQFISGDWWGRLKAGDSCAFERLFKHFYKPLCFFSERMLQDSSCSEDIVEDVFVKIWDRLEDFEDLSHIRNFAYRCCRNACLDHIKTSRRAGQRAMAYQESLDVQDDDLLREIIRAEVLGELHRAIHHLPGQCRKIMSLSYVEGCKNTEISRRLGISVQTVKNQKSRGVKLLQAGWAKHLYWLLPLLLPFQ